MSTNKNTMQRRSAVFFLYLHQLPRWVPLILLPAFLIAGMAAPGAIGAALLAMLAVLVWFAFMASPTRSASHKAVRLAVPLVILAVAVIKLAS